LELAFKKREYKVVNAKKRRRVDEDALWSWWMVRISLGSELLLLMTRGWL
jgi:hypothetical protein